MQKIAGTPSVIKQANQLLILELIQKATRYYQTGACPRYKPEPCYSEPRGG